MKLVRGLQAAPHWWTTRPTGEAQTTILTALPPAGQCVSLFPPVDGACLHSWPTPLGKPHTLGHVPTETHAHDALGHRSRCARSSLPLRLVFAPAPLGFRSRCAWSTAIPSTAAPFTAAPSTAAPSTAAPSPAAPSTAAPSTAALLHRPPQHRPPQHRPACANAPPRCATLSSCVSCFLSFLS